jgi:hypothetical protein
MRLDDEEMLTRFPMRPRQQVPQAFNEFFRSDGIRVIRAPVPRRGRAR